MECCRSWATLYDVAAAASRKCAARPWRFDRTAIFAHIDVFEQRCRCVEGQLMPGTMAVAVMTIHRPTWTAQQAVAEP